MLNQQFASETYGHTQQGIQERVNASQTLMYTTAYDVIKIYYMAQFDNSLRQMSSH